MKLNNWLKMVGVATMLTIVGAPAVDAMSGKNKKNENTDIERPDEKRDKKRKEQNKPPKMSNNRETQKKIDAEYDEKLDPKPRDRKK